MEPDYKSFAIAILDEWPDPVSDPFEIQELAHKHGMLRKERHTVPCGDRCGCAEVCHDGEEVDCYRKNWPTPNQDT